MQFELRKFKVLLFASAFLWIAPTVGHCSPRESTETTEGQHEILTVTPKSTFEIPARLKKNVDFWIDIYTKYGTKQGLIHDAKYIDLTYQILDLKDGKAGEHQIKTAKRYWKSVLMSLHHKTRNAAAMAHMDLTDDERKVFVLFANINEEDKFLNAAHRKRLRFQLGQKDRFLESLKASGRYMPLMEDVFRQQGLPVELVRLPLIESSFNLRARSKVGASGIWQFMRSTGKLFLRINDTVDERNDPVRATEAAAKLLKANYESLRTWPLAVTAYNHGRKGMMRAVARVGSDDLDDVVEDYHSRTFGFASSNYFCELLAGIEVDKNSDKYFGPIVRDQPLQYFEVELSQYIDIRELARFMKLDMDSVSELNPGLTEATLLGRRLLPVGYKLRLPLKDGQKPDTAAKVFLAGWDQIPAMYKLKGQKKYGRH
jgi:membrane-bound lytic murein transglycosylase D